MNRTEIVQELAKYAHPEWYHRLLNWGTEQLRTLLDYYQHPEHYHATSLAVVSMSPSEWTTVEITLEECPLCYGEGVVSCDEWDGDSGRYMPGVGSMRCQCTLED